MLRPELWTVVGGSGTLSQLGLPVVGQVEGDALPQQLEQLVQGSTSAA
jgi:hypothetical protein